MASPRSTRAETTRKLVLAIAATAALAACDTFGRAGEADSVYAPGVDLRKDSADGLEVGNRLLAASEYELALDAFTRAALDQGLTPDVLTGMGTANLGLGRLGQSEELLRRAVDAAPDWPEAWNNLGVVLLEQGKFGEAEQVFRKAYALDNGESDSIRDNLRLALAKSENIGHNDGQNQEYKVVRRGSSDYLIRKTP
ncbi:tetratricopeptide repeat protein [Sedimentitalea todarodis]|uniref:Tetratricopeptide repeat protein n=1 Tax=Sedimentitalea todarodis TaxID=1631240 RepID=A0ABU3V8I8_9RHOB|nr:tetratricopeptide repeat protein [Sedimentitalea todarodis]MDU9002465.1 tetratricopeptide repeat protein [Sedimentitalea todarodis]